ncbi:MAG: ORF6N domain-containing protein [Ferruginibacter sp.]
MQIIQSIQNKIYEIRGERVMLDRDLASLYEVETRVLNQAVKRNIRRFPEDFMFRLTKAEFESIKFRSNKANEGFSMSSQFVMTYSDKRPATALPYAFTEQGVAMLSGVINSEKAISMNIAIMRAFVAVRQVLIKQNDIKEQLQEIKERIGDHDIQLNQIYDAMENLLDEKAEQRKWNDRNGLDLRNDHPYFKHV